MVAVLRNFSKLSPRVAGQIISLRRRGGKTLGIGSAVTWRAYSFDWYVSIFQANVTSQPGQFTRSQMGILAFHQVLVGAYTNTLKRNETLRLQFPVISTSYRHLTDLFASAYSGMAVESTFNYVQSATLFMESLYFFVNPRI